MRKKWLSMALALILCMSLLPTGALAYEGEIKPVYDVYQGDGFYITATPFTIKSTKYTMGNSAYRVLDGQFHDGLFAVKTNANVDENYINRKFIDELNYVDKNGNVMFPEGIFHFDWDMNNYGREGDFSPSEGLIPYWDGESKAGSKVLFGFVDYNGNEVIPCQYEAGMISPFCEGLSNASPKGVIDKSGRIVIEYGSIFVHNSMRFSDGLIPCRETDYGSNTRTHGYMDKSGNMVLKLLSYNRDDLKAYDSDYWRMCADGKTDGYLLPFETPTGSFSDGYTVCYDLRSGNQLDYNFAIIDKNGNVVGAFSDAQPEGVRDKGGFHDGLLRVQFIDNRNYGGGYGFVDTSGNVVISEKRTSNPTVDWVGNISVADYSCGLLAFSHFVVDTKGNIVIPEGQFVAIKTFDSNLSMAFLKSESSIAGIYTPYVLEKHQGTYTGSGSVYNHAKGGAQTPNQPTQPTTPATPTQPTAPAAPTQPSGNLAYASTQTVLVDGKAVNFEMYALKDANGNPTNYIKLRDIASVVNGTAAQFEVGWNGAVNIETGKAYTANGSEMKTPYSGDRAYKSADSATTVNGGAASLEAIVLTDDNGGAYTYYKLRDLGMALGFNVGWSVEKGVFVETDKPYSV